MKKSVAMFLAGFLGGVLVDFSEASPGIGMSIANGIANEKIGYALWDRDEDKLLDSHREKQVRPPASVIKVLTGLSAIKVLGPNYRFRTEILLTKNGDLVLRGGGDPLLAATDLMKLVHGLKRLKVKTNGSFIVDQSFLPSFPVINSDRLPEDPYNASVGALSAEFNQSLVRWGKDGVYQVPELFFQPVKSPDKKLSFSKNQKFQFKGDELFAKVHGFGAERVPVRDSALYTGVLFQKLCSLVGVKLSAPKIGKTPQGAAPILVHESKVLKEIVISMWEYSNNLAGELVFLSTASQISKSNPKTKTDLYSLRALMNSWVRKELPGVNWNNLSWRGGSGLRPETKISPLQLVQSTDLLLQGIGASEEDLLSSFPLLGWKGSFGKRFIEAPLAFRVWAKTGSIDYVSALAGILYTKSGKQLIFSILIADLKQRKKSDPYDARSASAWSRDARDIQERLIKGWLAKY